MRRRIRPMEEDEYFEEERSFSPMRSPMITPIIRTRLIQESHDSDWDGIPNRMDSSPLGIPITRGYRGLLYRDFWYRGQR